MPKTIAWLDDDNALIGSIVEPLEWDGHRVNRYESVKEARNNIADLRKADLLLLDVILPTGEPDQPMTKDYYTGVTLLTELRKQQVNAPAIILTVVGRSTSEHNSTKELEALFAKIPNVVAFIHKPILPSELKRAIYDSPGWRKDN